MDFFAQEKREVETLIVKAMINAISKEELAETDLPVISSYVLEKIAHVKTLDDLMQFLRDLSARWSIFTPILVGKGQEIQELNEKKAVEDVLDLARDNKIEQALHLAKSMTQN